jgi:exo-beta-1,3-glucanase (GH17 family)
VDFISIHTYPVWEYKHINEALDYTKENYYSVVKKYPHKPVVITEAGWATSSNGRGINPENVNEEYQKMYYDKLMDWTAKENILVFFFEAFDESWKGSPEPLEPEKHWGFSKLTEHLSWLSIIYFQYKIKKSLLKGVGKKIIYL